jgi:hypothetical protein
VLLLSLWGASVVAFGQDLNCTVDVLTGNIQQTNKQIFEDLKNSITQFMNNKKWMVDKVEPNEKIDCNLVIEITDFSVDKFKANFNIQSSRTAYNTSYNSMVFTYLDNDVQFEYAQFQAIDFQEGNFSSNLPSVLAFYANIIVGMDFDTYGLQSGETYFKKALNIRDVAMNTGQGWNSTNGNGNRNRYFLVDNLLDSRFKPLRVAYYRYHFKGLDAMTSDMDAAREEIYQSLKELKQLHSVLPNALLLRLFFNAKSDELIQIYSKAGPSQKNRVVELLSSMDPANRGKYEEGILKAKD